jgi:plastocyanin
MRFPAFFSSFVILAFVAGCSSKPESSPNPAAGGGKHVDAATAGTVTGRVTFEGTPPAPEPLKMASDPACTAGSGPNPQNDAVLIHDGGVQNVFVYVKAGLDPAYSFDVPSTPVELDQRGCRYVPRVFGVRVGQPITVLNGDDTLHNVHSLPKNNREFNNSMNMKGERRSYTFDKPEVMVRFKCDVHSWMAAYAGVMASPFFAVTKPDGSFEIAGLPPGTYTIEAWHERFGTRTQQVTLGDHQTQTISFTLSDKS